MHIHSSRDDWTKTTKNRLNQARGERMIPTHARTCVCVLILATRVRVLVCAMARRFYNEHLHYPDPFSAASKSTRHRQLKKRKLSVENTEEPSRPYHTDTLLLGTTVLSPLDFAENLEASDVDVSDNEATEGHHEQFSAENELHNAVEEDYGEFCADNNDDLPDEERFTAEDQSSLSSSEAMVFQNCPLTVTSSLLLIKKYGHYKSHSWFPSCSKFPVHAGGRVRAWRKLRHHLLTLKQEVSLKQHEKCTKLLVLFL